MNKKGFILILGLAGFIVMADNWVVSPILPAIADNIGVPVTSAGLLISAYMLPFGLFQLIFGPLADRFGKRQIISISMVAFTVATGLCAIGSSLTDLSVYRALTGIFAASVMPVSLALIADLFPIEERQTAIGMFMGISFLGQGLSMAIGGSIAFFTSWRGVFVLYAVLSLLSTVLLLTAGRSIPSSKNPDSRFLKPYVQLVSHGQSAWTYIVVVLEGILIIGSFSYLGGFLEHQFQLNYLKIGFIMTAFGVMAVIGGRISGKLSDKLGRRKVLLLGLACATAGNGLFTSLGTSLPVVIVGVGLLGLGFMLAHSSLLTRATLFAKKARGAAMSLVAFCFMGGGGIGTAIGGKYIAHSSYTSFFGLYGVLLAVLLILAGIVIRQEPHTEAA